jgi:uncharacterized protein DUF6941
VNIDWVIPCRYVEVHDNLGTIIGAGIDTLWVPELPTQIQVILAVRLLAMVEELGPEQQHTAVNRVRDPRGEIMSEVGGEFAIGAEAARPEWLAGFIMGTVVQFEAIEEGTYTIEHVVDDASASLPIHVVLGYPRGAAPPENEP